MQSNGHTDARTLHARLSHPIWGEVNPDFFKGTVVEKAAAEVLAQGAR
ncbi:MAG: hypothetical protein ACREN5_17510 [Gemmatimonadales bacterium]